MSPTSIDEKRITPGLLRDLDVASGNSKKHGSGYRGLDVKNLDSRSMVSSRITRPSPVQATEYLAWQTTASLEDKLVFYTPVLKAIQISRCQMQHRHYELVFPICFSASFWISVTTTSFFLGDSTDCLITPSTNSWMFGKFAVSAFAHWLAGSVIAIFSITMVVPSGGNRLEFQSVSALAGSHPH